MNFNGHSFTTLDHDKDCYMLTSGQILTARNTTELRETLEANYYENYPIIYLDLQNVEEMDLYGANEVIHAHFSLQLVSKKLVLIYRKNSVVEQWVQTTGLERFIETSVTT